MSREADVVESGVVEAGDNDGEGNGGSETQVSEAGDQNGEGPL